MYYIHLFNNWMIAASHFHTSRCCGNIWYEMLVPLIHFSVINLKTIPKIDPCSELSAVDCAVLESDLSVWHFLCSHKLYMCAGILLFILCMWESCGQIDLCPENFSVIVLSVLSSLWQQPLLPFYPWIYEVRNSVCTFRAKCEHSQVQDRRGVKTISSTTSLFYKDIYIYIYICVVTEDCI
jgi:hypothetical protein